MFDALLAGEGEVDAIIEFKGLVQVTDTGAIEAIVDEVITENPDQVVNYRAAPDDKKGKMLGFFVGQVMKKSQGKANPQAVNPNFERKTLRLIHTLGKRGPFGNGRTSTP